MIYKRFMFVLATCLAVSSAFAQTGTLTISHNDPDGLVAPGQIVQFSVALNWSERLFFWEIAGNVVASPDAGAAANPVFGVTNPPTIAATVINAGSATAGGISGVHVLSGFNPGSGFPPLLAAPWWADGFSLLHFEWTAPAEPGTVDFSWIARPDIPHPLIFTSHLTSIPTAIPTTSFGTSLIVVPAPASALLLALAPSLLLRRRRR